MESYSDYFGNPKDSTGERNVINNFYDKEGHLINRDDEAAQGLYLDVYFDSISLKAIPD